jgi:hypothetical protein
MTPKRLIERAPDDQEERVALYPDLPFEDAVAALLAVDPRKSTESVKVDDEHS